MSYSFSLENYRKIKSASVSTDGITLIFGANGSGKSSFFKGVRSLIDLSVSDKSIRHGEATCVIGVQADKDKIIYWRDSDGNHIQWNDEDPRTKLGKASLDVVEPRFKLKRHTYGDVKFYPNFAMQGKTPLFDDIDVSVLFSALFEKISKVSDITNEVGRNVKGLASSLHDSETELSYVQSLLSTETDVLAALEKKYPDIDTQYKSLEVLKEKYKRVVAIAEEKEALERICTDSLKMRLVSDTQASNAVLADFDFVSTIESSRKTLTAFKDNLAAIEKQLSILSDIDFALVSMIESTVLTDKEKIAVAAYDDLSAIDLDLVLLVESLVKEQSSLNSSTAQLEAVNKEISDLGVDLASIESCPLKEAGLCRWMSLKELDSLK